jgi:hypothetical protein
MEKETLKEKLFNAIFDNAFEFKTENVVPECEQIADEYAVEFAVEFGKWLNNQVISSSGRHHNLLGVTKVTQLLPIFKKEKGWTI